MATGLKNSMQRLRSFKVKLILSFAALLVIPFTFVYFNLDQKLENSVLEDIKSSLIRQAMLIEDSLISGAGLLHDPVRLDAAIKRFSSKIPARITVINPAGVVLADSQKAFADIPAMENHGQRPEVRAAVNNVTGSEIRYSATLKADMLYVAVPLKSGGSIQAVLRLALPLERIQAVLGTTRKTLLFSLLVGLGAAFILGTLLARSFIRPVNRFIYASEKFSKGEFSHRIHLDSPDEMGRLAQTLNGMAGHIEEKIRLIEVQNQQLRAIFQSMVEGIMVLDKETAVIAVNPAIERMFAVTQSRAQGKTFLEIIPNNDIAEVIHQVLRSNTIVSRELAIVWPVHKILQLNAVPIVEAGAVAGCLIVAHDVTEMRRLETVRTDFVANVSHELKTPLTSIKGFVETLREGALEDKEHAVHFLHIIQEHTDRLNNLINDLLDLSYLESKGSALAKEQVKFKDLVDKVFSDFGVSIKKKSIAVKNLIPSDMSVLADKAKIEQVFTNLIDNAVKFNKEKGELVIACREEAGKIVVSVQDSGIGIPVKDLPRIFERFYRVDKARSRELGGTGLGLSIVKHIVELHNGAVGVESTEGIGSRFWFTLPL